MNLLDEEKQTLEEYLLKIYAKSEMNLNEIIELINDLQRKDVYSNFSYFHIQNLKLNLHQIEENNSHRLKLILSNIKEETNEMSMKLNESIDNETNSLMTKKLNEFFCIIVEHLRLKQMFDSIGLFDRIESIISLFTGIGVLGIIPLETPLILTNRASEIMFKDKLKDVEDRLNFLLRFLRTSQIQQIENLHKYFQDFTKTVSTI